MLCRFSSVPARAFLASWAFLLSTSILVADGLVFRLPEDGASARYSAKVTHSINGKEIVIKGHLTMSSVGKETVDKQPCRWLEFKMTNIRPDGQEGPSMIAKVLIPEKALQAGENPGAHVIRGWRTTSNTEAERISDISMSPPLLAYLSGPPVDAKELAKEKIETPIGTLECDGITGSTEFSTKDGKKTVVHSQVRLHDSVPFGVVRARMEMDKQGVIELELLEVTKNARSELPNN